VQAVDVLRDDGIQPTCGFQSGQGLVCAVGVDGMVDLAEPLPVRFGVPGEKVDAQDGLEGNLALLEVEAVRPAKIGDPRLGGDTRAPEKHGGR
jgi:hypothetical protein